MASRQPTRYEQELMETLGFSRLEDLQAFLNLPPLPTLRMQPPEPLDQGEIAYQESQQA